MDMAMLDSNGGGGSDVAGTTGGVLGVAEGAEDATSGIGLVEDTVGASALMSVGISTGCGSTGCSGVESLDAQIQLGLLALHHKLSYSSICRE
ncbi:hypothetical protein VitviT2T_008583 [Vitis vinifera]|uniref:Uncharacterized protein n=1 Tax=Vitis vinifera TaxID=29760 RepID=A0ABY9C5D7_VITVI|nr:hypothetical protein VitviT2T_008583 [Vitis vinifera]